MGAGKVKNSDLQLLHIVVSSMFLILYFDCFTLDLILCSSEIINLPILTNNFENYMKNLVEMVCVLLV